MSNLEQNLDQSQIYWNDMAAQHHDDSARVEQSSRAQRMRYEAFVLAHDLQGKSILDVGCGTGSLWEHLQHRGIACNYFGVDLSAKMIERCHERFPDIPFEVANLLEWQPAQKFDYVVSFGIHNVRLDKMEELLLRMTQRQFELAQVAAHISILTDRFPGEFADHIFAWRAEHVLSQMLEITPYVTLRHDYLPNDFSLTLYHQLLIDTAPNLMLDY